MDNISVIVLAAGEGTRMKTALPKVLHKVNGLPMLLHLLRTTKQLALAHTMVVLGYKKDKVIEVLPPGIAWVEQKEQLGTGHAVQVALQGSDELRNTILVLCGDIPLLTAATLENLIKTHQDNGCAITILSALLDDPFPYGRIVRDATGQVVRIVEEKDASEEERKIKEINSGIYCFNKSMLETCLAEVTTDNEQKEYYLTDVVEICRSQGGKVDAVIAKDSWEISGINTLKDLAWASKMVNGQVIEHWLSRGVTIIDPDNTYIDCRAEIGKDTIIQPFTHLEGETVIGQACNLGPSVRICECKLDDQVNVQFSVLEKVNVQSNCTVAPFSYVSGLAESGAEEHI